VFFKFRFWGEWGSATWQPPPWVSPCQSVCFLWISYRNFCCDIAVVSCRKLASINWQCHPTKLFSFGISCEYSSLAVIESNMRQTEGLDHSAAYSFLARCAINSYESIKHTHFTNCRIPLSHAFLWRLPLVHPSYRILLKKSSFLTCNTILEIFKAIM
jgi:hypothetical protein